MDTLQKYTHENDSADPSKNKKILRLSSVKIKTGLARSTLYLKISQGTFPTPISLSERSVGWLESEVDQWIDQCVKKSRAQKGGATHA